MWNPIYGIFISKLGAIQLIRILMENDRAQTLTFVAKKPAENLFIIGDIEMYGFDNPIQTLWGDFTTSGDLRAVLLKYDSNYIVYAPAEFDAEGIAAIINNDTAFEFISGIEYIVEQLKPFLTVQPSNPRVLFYAKCEQAKDLAIVPKTVQVKKALPNDAPRIIEQMVAIPEFSTSAHNIEQKRTSLQNGSARTYYIEDENSIVSSASSTAENSQSAMIVGVATLANHQNKGLASYCMSALCSELLKEGKMLCLFYDNPTAGALYKRIGFKDIGKWCMWSFSRQKI